MYPPSSSHYHYSQPSSHSSSKKAQETINNTYLIEAVKYLGRTRKKIKGFIERIYFDSNFESFLSLTIEMIDELDSSYMIWYKESLKLKDNINSLNNLKTLARTLTAQAQRIIYELQINSKNILLLWIKKNINAAINELRLFYFELNEDIKNFEDETRDIQEIERIKIISIVVNMRKYIDELGLNINRFKNELTRLCNSLRPYNRYLECFCIFVRGPNVSRNYINLFQTIISQFLIINSNSLFTGINFDFDPYHDCGNVFKYVSDVNKLFSDTIRILDDQRLNTRNYRYDNTTIPNFNEFLLDLINMCGKIVSDTQVLKRKCLDLIPYSLSDRVQELRYGRNHHEELNLTNLLTNKPFDIKRVLPQSVKREEVASRIMH